MDSVFAQQICDSLSIVREPHESSVGDSYLHAHLESFNYESDLNVSAVIWNISSIQIKTRLIAILIFSA